MITKNRPKKAYPADTQMFRNWMDSVPSGQHAATVLRVIAACKVNRNKYKNWMAGRTSFSPLEKEAINELAGAEVFAQIEGEVKP